jgi:hypothetical protein
LWNILSNFSLIIFLKQEIITAVTSSGIIISFDLQNSYPCITKLGGYFIDTLYCRLTNSEAARHRCDNFFCTSVRNRCILFSWRW